MSLSSKAVNFLFLILVIIFLKIISSLYQLHPLPPIHISQQQRTLNLDHSLFHYFNLGNKRLMADLFWIQTLLQSDLEHYQGSDLNSWMFLRFNTITTLDPQFLEAYLFGGKYLSVVKDDDYGASTLFDKGLLAYPHHYELNYASAIHDYLELGKAGKAYHKLRTIQDHPQAPPHLKSLTAKMKAESGDIENAYWLLLDSYHQEDDQSPIKKHFHKLLYALKAEKDLKCLNSMKKRGGCEEKDFNGKNYIQRSNGFFYAPQSWLPVRPHRREALPKVSQ